MAKYNEKELADTSKFLSFVLRHKPEAIGIVLDREGWADIDKLILCAQKAGKRLTRALLDTVVATSDKKRFSHSSDGRCIRRGSGAFDFGRPAIYLCRKNTATVSLPRYGKPFP